jgi:D-alanine-D-alanine ligase-like ATP-grasp enzyme
LKERTVSFGQQTQVHVLSWRPRPILWEVQNFLNRYGLSILFFGLHTFQGEQGETIAIAEPIVVPLAVSSVSTEGVSVHRVGEVESFLRSLGETTT